MGALFLEGLAAPRSQATENNTAKDLKPALTFLTEADVLLSFAVASELQGGPPAKPFAFNSAMLLATPF